MASFACDNPSSETLAAIGKKISNGKWALADFQRDNVWTWPKESLFFKSIYQGVPLGSIYVWEWDEKRPKRGISGLEEFVDYDSPESLIIDGQQRSTALGKLWYSVRHKGKGYHSVVFNVKEAADSPNEGIYFTKMKETGEPNASKGEIHLQTLLRAKGPANVKRSIRGESWYDPVKHGEVVDFLHDAFNNRRMNIQKVYKSVTRPYALDIFYRVNKAGTTLSDNDMLEAILVMLWDKLYYEIRDFVPKISSHSWGEKDGNDDRRQTFEKCFNREVILKSILFQLHESTAKSENINIFKPLDNKGRKLTGKKVEAAFKKTKKAMEDLKKHIEDRLGFHDLSGFSLFTALILVQHLIAFKEPSEKNLNKMLAWFCIANIGPPVSKFVWTGASTNDWADADCKTASESANCWDALLVRLQKRKEKVQAIAQMDNLLFTKDHLRSLGETPVIGKGIFRQLTHTLLLRKQAKDWMSGHVLSNLDRNNIDLHHIFPATYFKPSAVQVILNQNKKKDGTPKAVSSYTKDKLREILDEAKIIYADGNKDHLVKLVEKESKTWWQKFGEDLQSGNSLKDHPANLAWVRPYTNRYRIKAQLPEIYLKHIYDERLDDQVIPRSDRSLWTQGKYDKFIEKRSEGMISAINTEIKNLWGNKKSTSKKEKTPRIIIKEFRKNGESAKIEVKASFQFCTTEQKTKKILRHQIARAIIAMMNSGGGHLLVGFNDNTKAAIGIGNDLKDFDDDVEKMENGLFSALKKMCKPSKYWDELVTYEKIKFSKKDVYCFNVLGAPTYVTHKKYRNGTRPPRDVIWVRNGPQTDEYTE